MGVFLRKYSLVDSHQTIISLSVISCHAVHPEGFRLKDVQFHIELIANWASIDQNEEDFSVQLVQVKRYLDSFDTTVVKKLGKKGKIRYSLTFSGVIKILESFVGQDKILSMEEILVSTFIFSHYQELLKSLLLESGKYLNEHVKAKLEALINPKSFIEFQIKKLESLKSSLEHRIHDNTNMTDEIDQLYAESYNTMDILKQIDQKYSYQLAYRKSLSSLLIELPRDFLAYEFKYGFKRRNQMIFKNQMAYLDTLLLFLNEILEQISN